MRTVARWVCALAAIAAVAASAPAFSGAGPSISGCPILPVDNIWNTAVDGLPVDSNSEAYISSIGGDTGVHPDFGSGLWERSPIGIPYNVVPGTQPKVSVGFDYSDESDPGPYPIPADALIEGGSDSSGDRHVLVLDSGECILYELYSAYPQPDGSWLAGSGAVFDLRSNALRPQTWTSADAAGLPVLPGLVRYEEIAAGEIGHAIRFTAPHTRKAYVWPARHYASSLTSANYPPMGQRFRLRADFDVSGFSPEVQVILHAMKKYGLILADNGSAWYISGVPDSRWNNDALVSELRLVKGSDFEAVDQSGLMVDPDSGQAQQDLPDTQAPTVPAGLAATVVSSARIDLSWAASTDDVGVAGYRIIRAGREIGMTTGTSYQDSSLLPSKSYSYRVSAYDEAGNCSTLSAAAAAKTQPRPSTKFAITDRVVAMRKIIVRSVPSSSGSLLGTQFRGISGTVSEGPWYANGLWWWKVNFDQGPSGWTPHSGLKKRTE